MDEFAIASLPKVWENRLGAGGEIPKAGARHM